MVDDDTSPNALSEGMHIASEMDGWSAEHATGVYARDCIRKGTAEAAVVRLVRTVGEERERKDVEQILRASQRVRDLG